MKRLSTFIDQKHIGSIEKQIPRESKPTDHLAYKRPAHKVSTRKPRSYAENMPSWPDQQDGHQNDKSNKLDRVALMHLPLSE